MSIVALLLALLAGQAVQPDKLAADPSLRPYVEELRKETPAATLDKITIMSESELVRLQFGYGTWIRNTWLYNKRDSALTRYFRQHGITHPDDISRILIRALWNNLNQTLTPEQRVQVEARRRLAARKRNAYAMLSQECSDQLKPSKDLIESCYHANGLPSKNQSNRNPFRKLIVKKNGAVGEIVFFEGASDGLKRCLKPILDGYHFSPLEYDEQLTLYITQFPYCGVLEYKQEN
jgi:hypothetical protein